MTSRPRSHSASTRRSTARRSRSRCRPRSRARPVTAPAPSPARAPRVCPVCKGRGVESQSQGIFSISQPCSNCGGSGTVIDDPCPTCGGTGAQRSVTRLRVNIPAGVRDGSRIRLAGKGEPGAPRRRRARRPVRDHAGQGLAGVQARRRQPRGRGAADDPRGDPRSGHRGPDAERLASACAFPRGTKHGTVQRLRGEGPPRLGGKGRGDIHYRFVIDVPASLSPEQTDAVDKLSEVMNGDPRARAVRGRATRAASALMATASARRSPTHDRGRGLLRSRRVHDLGRRRARRDASADAADVRGARADRAEALAEGDTAVLARRTSTGCGGSRR